MEVLPVIQLSVAGLDVTLIALRKSKGDVRKAAGPALLAGGKAYRNMVRKRISLRDHSLADLARKDHPYARRHGSIRIHRRKPWQVHRQSGRMVNALQGRPITIGGSQGYEVTFDYNAAPHARYVIQGTRVMLRRDVLWRTAYDDKTKEAMMKRIVKVLGKQLRTQLGVRFGSGAPSASIGRGGSASAVR